ncbi:MAG: hypothetical protein LBV69_05585 [Bacteroidales bacterium]|jgi:hypothetical protein|nr:hypothetical protein [Bacteroidales bacterium]
MKNLENFNEKLTENELNELIGGIKSNYGTSKDGSTEEIKNLNTVASCMCNYNNHQNLINENTVGGCNCNCTLL